MTDDEIVDAVKDKYDIPLATGVFYKAHLDLVRMGREDERKQIVAWLRAVQGLWADEYAAQIEAGEHLK